MVKAALDFIIFDNQYYEMIFSDLHLSTTIRAPMLNVKMNVFPDVFMN